MSMKLLIVLLFSVSTTYAADYIMACRGGRLATLSWELENGVAADIQSYDFVFGFAKSTVAAKYPYTNLAEGTCAWNDRPFNVNEKSQLVVRNAPFIGKIKYNAKYKKIISVFPAMESSSDSTDKLKVFAKYLKDAGDNTKILKFRARALNDGTGRLQITTFGY